MLAGVMVFINCALAANELISTIDEIRYTPINEKSTITFTLQRVSLEDSILLLAKIGSKASIAFNYTIPEWKLDYHYYNLDLWITEKYKTQLTIPYDENTAGDIFFSIFSLNNNNTICTSHSISEIISQFCADNCFANGCRSGQCGCPSIKNDSSCFKKLKPVHLDDFYNETLKTNEIRFLHLDISDPIKMEFKFYGNDSSKSLVFLKASDDFSKLISMLDYSELLMLPQDLHQSYEMDIGVQSVIWGVWCIDQDSCAFELKAEVYKNMKTFIIIVITAVCTICISLLIICLVILCVRRRNSRTNNNEVFNDGSSFAEYNYIYKQVEWNQTYAVEICSICYENFINSSTIRILSCKHIFHSDCIDRWVQIKMACPCCNKPL